MSKFIISRPYASPNLKLTYNKDFVVIEHKQDDSKVAHTLNLKKNVWKTSNKIPSKYKQGLTHRILTLSDVINNDRKSWVNYMAFDSLEEAYLAKAYLIERMRKNYTEEINDMLKRIETNVPDLSNIMEDLTEKYPEYFI